MKIPLVALLAGVIVPAYAQGEGPSTMDLIILFAVAIAFVAGIVIFISREVILRKKTDYDRGSFDSQKNRDYEKYHSEWSDESAKEDHTEDYTEESDLPDYYSIMGLEKTASKAEIKSRYRMLAKKLHPDKTKDGSTKDEMAKINRAYEVLSDDEKKAIYDRSRN